MTLCGWSTSSLRFSDLAKPMEKNTAKYASAMDAFRSEKRWNGARAERGRFECVLCPPSFGWLLGHAGEEEDMRTSDEDGTSCAVSSIELDADTM
jgi:hypothetical protein